MQASRRAIEIQEAGMPGRFRFLGFQWAESLRGWRVEAAGFRRYLAKLVMPCQ